MYLIIIFEEILTINQRNKSNHVISHYFHV